MSRSALVAAIVLTLAALFAAAISAAAAAGVTVESFLAVPAQVEPDETVTLRVALTDPQDAVAKVSVSVRALPTMQAALKPAAEGMWTGRMGTPPTALPGRYALDLTLLGAGGEPVAARGSSSFELEVVAPGSKRLAERVAGKLAELRQLLDAPLGQWRWHAGDAPGAERPDLDDSSWALGDPPITWEPGETVCWFRKELAMRDQVGGFDVTGSPARLLVEVEEDGEIYVNGQRRQRFKWNDGRVVLTERARPGEKFLVALKVGNSDGRGRLLRAGLRMESLDVLRREAGAYLGDLEFGHQVLRHIILGGEQLREMMAASVAAVDLEALAAGDRAAFLASLRAARAPLRPIASELKNYAVRLVGHAHIDFNRSWPETAERSRRAFRRALDLMNEYPQFTFSQSQPALYLWMEQGDPDLFAQIAGRVAQGRWEVIGSTWVEGNLDMLSGESIVRQILYAKRYVREKFGVDVRVAWEPDAFGHPWTMPQILQKAGIDYYYLCRGGEGIPLFWWEAPQGSRVLACNLGRYDAPVTPEIGDVPAELKPAFGVADSLHVYGSGDHGSGPSREDLEAALELEQRMIFPRVTFATAHGFFDRVLSQTTEFPIVRDELGQIFDGSYTTHADIKRMNRISENLLPTAEAFSTLAAGYGHPYPRADLLTAWRHTCFNQSQGILGGSAAPGAYEHARELFEQAHGLGSDALRGALEALSARVDTRGSGAAVVVFNPMAWTRTDAAAASVGLAPGTTGVTVSDDRGRDMPSQVLGRDPESGLLRVGFTAAEVPSLGYRVFHVERAPETKPRAAGAAADDSGRIENEFWRLQLDLASGTLSGIYDKRRGVELVPAGQRANLFQALYEKPHPMSASIIGEISRTENLDGRAEVRVIERGPARAVIRVTREWRGSTFTQDLILYAGVERIDFVTSADWREVGAPGVDFPMIKVAFPVALSRTQATFEIPFGAIPRAGDGRELPALKWVDLSGIADEGAAYGLSLLNDCKYGHDVSGSVVRLTLLRCSYEPDPLPDRGVHHFTYSLYPHAGAWRRSATVRQGCALNNPLVAIAQPAHAGELAPSHSFLRVEPQHLIVSALKRAEDCDDVIVRCYESEGAPARARITPGFGWAAAVEVNLMEKATGGAVDAGAEAIEFDVGPWEIKTLRLSRDGSG